MKQSNTARFAYLAGVIDADGCIQIRKFRRADGYGYDCAILVNHTDGRALDFCVGAFGGSIYTIKNYQAGSNRKRVWRWEIRGDAAADVCKRIVPFLRIKKDQGELLIRFRTAVNRSSARKVAEEGWEGGRLLPHELAEREELYVEMRRLKRNIQAPSAAVTTKWTDSSDGMGSDSLADEEEELVGIST